MGSGIYAIVYVDDRRVGTLDNGESFTIDLSTGSHQIAIESTKETSSITMTGFGMGTVRNGNRSKISSLEIPEGTKSVRVQAGVRTGKGFFSNESFIDVVDVQMR